MINRFFRRTRGPSNASSEVQWQTSSSEKAPSLPDIGKLRDFYVSGSQRNWESSADKIWFVNSFEEHVAPLLEARETTQKSARPPRPSTKPPLNPPHSEPPAPPPPPPTNEQFTPPGSGGSEGEKPGTAVVASLGSPGKDEEKYLLARYGDNGLETQWRTAVNELESTRAHRDVLTEELASARSEVEDMKQQLLASMSETKKALRTQLSAARGEVEALRAQLLAADKGEGALPATSGSAEGAMAMQASENLHHRQLSIMKNKTWNAKPKKGCKFSENLTAVKEFIIPASFEGNEYESVDGRYHRGISIASETDGGGGPVEQLASASESSNAMQPRNSTSSTTMHLFQGKELAKLINGNKQRRASSGGATTKDNNNAAATAGTQPPAATVPSDLVPAASEGSNAAPMSSGAGRILSKLKKSDSYPLEGWESSSANLMIISDLDGTLLPAPKKVNGKVVHPIMSEGAAYAPLMRLLEFGATIVGVTGSRLTMHKPRFWDELPLSARKEGRVLLFCETGMVLYRPDENTGEPIEDETYGPFPGNEKRFLRTETVDGLVAAARQGLREWFSDLRDDRTLLEEGHFLHALAERWADEDAPVTLDASQTPRIELRGPSSTKVVGVMIAGIPLKTPRGSGLPDKYLTSKFKPFENEIHGQPTGRLCYDCVVPGLSKHLVLNYLLRTGVLTKGAAFALADSPAGNDVGLTQFHDCGMPFVSVSADVAKCPEHLRSCHVGGNERGSGAFLQEVVKQWGSVGEGGFHRLKGSDGRLTVRKVEELAEAAAEAL